MSSPLSPIIADLVIQDLEREVLRKLDFRLPFYFRYVDDILTAVPKTTIDSIVDKLVIMQNRGATSDLNNFYICCQGHCPE